MLQNNLIENILFVLPHPDDEVGIICRIKKYIAEKKNVYCIWITDGSLTANKEIREQESIKVMKMIEVPLDNLHFLNYKDGKCIFKIDEIIKAISQLVKSIHPKEIYTTAYEGGHPDHDCVNFCVNYISQQLNITVYEFPLYNSFKSLLGRFGKFVPAETKTLSTNLGWEIIGLKLKTVLKHKSQWKGLFPFILFNMDKKEMLKKNEPYRLIPDWNYTLPPYPAKLFYEKFLYKLLKIKYNDFKLRVENFLQQTKN